jgi:hypothetical protein
VTCHRYHLDHTPTSEEFDRLAAEIFGQPLDETREVGDRPLDDILASRGHLRVLRVVSLVGDEVNLTGRDIAGRGGISRARAQDVLRELVSAGIVKQHRGATWAIYEINGESPIAPLIRALFEAERDLTPA